MKSVIQEISRYIITRCPDTGVVLNEEYEDNKGRPHRYNGPAIISRDRDKKHITKIMYFIHGQCTRENDLPAVECFDEETGKLIWRAWQYDNEYFRENGLPHVEYLDPETGNVYRAEYRIKNSTKKGWALHNENGPAVIFYDRNNGQPTTAEYYKNGRKQTGSIQGQSTSL